MKEGTKKEKLDAVRKVLGLYTTVIEREREEQKRKRNGLSFNLCHLALMICHNMVTLEEVCRLFSLYLCLFSY